MTDQDRVADEDANRKVGGRPVENTLEYNWHARLKMVWNKRPDLKKGVQELHALALAIGSVGASDHDFGRKLNGKRGANEQFARILFQAAGLDLEDIRLEDWLADEDAWENAIEGLRDTRIRDRFGALTAEETLDIKVTSRPFLTPVLTMRRGRNRTTDNILKVGEEIVLSLAYRGDRPINRIHILMFEYMGEGNEVQVLNAISNCKLRYDQPVILDLLPDDSARGYDDGLDIEATEPAQCTLFVFVSPAGFDHRLVRLIGQLRGADWLIPRTKIDEVLALLEGSRDGLLVGFADYRIQS